MNYYKENANLMLKALIGSDEFVAAWWTSPNLFFNLKTPETVWESNPKSVYDYLEFHASK
jgi:hypothetical protein